MAVYTAVRDEEIARCFQVMAQLRPDLLEGAFVSSVRAQQAQGYQLAYLLEDDAVVAVSGFRVMDMLVGRTLYVDDLVTDPRTAFARTRKSHARLARGPSPRSRLHCPDTRFRHPPAGSPCLLFSRAHAGKQLPLREETNLARASAAGGLQ